MLVILEAVSGPIAGRRIEIRAGTILRIGRTAKSDYALGEDSYLSGQHFAIENDGADARARDLGSSNGTFVNGERVTSDAVLREGDSLTAGGSTFTVHLDTVTEPSKKEPSPAFPRCPPMRSRRRERRKSSARILDCLATGTSGPDLHARKGSC